MAKPLLVVLGGAIVLAAGISWLVPRLTAAPELPLVDVSASNPDRKDEPSAGLCPWRDPDADLKRFFPGATASRDTTLILTRHREEMAKRLGRAPTGDDNAIKIYRVFHGTQAVGTIVPRRLRGESGVIELILAVNTAGRVAGAKIQRLREPDAVARVLQSDQWLGAFRGLTAQSAFKIGGDIPDVPAAARPSAQALLDETRTALILLDIARAHLAAAHQDHDGF